MEAVSKLPEAQCSLQRRLRVLVPVCYGARHARGQAEGRRPSGYVQGLQQSGGARMIAKDRERYVLTYCGARLLFLLAMVAHDTSSATQAMPVDRLPYD